MRIANGVEMLEIGANLMGRPSTIYPTLVWEEGRVILVDAGYPGQLLQIREAMEEAEVPFSQLSAIILTHQDIDHIGSAASIEKEVGHPIQIMAHEKEKPYIQGDARPIKLAQLEANADALPPQMKAIYEKLRTGFESSKVGINKTLIQGEQLPYCGGMTIIHTPGHTPGHICLYLIQHKLLIAGDLLAVDNGSLVTAPKHINFDNSLSMESLRKLAQYPIEKVICYHGGLYGEKVNERIQELIKEKLP